MEVLVEIIDASHCYLVPGFVDSLVHFIGGGGEGGFASRTPEMQLTDATLGGVTTAIGVLGTDATTRTLTNLLAKAHALDCTAPKSIMHGPLCPKLHQGTCMFPAVVPFSGTAFIRTSAR